MGSGFSATGDPRAARESVQQALALTWHEGFVRLFADEGSPVIRLLGQLASELRRGRHADAPYRGYMERLLSILTGAPSGSAPARELFMGLSTVKWLLLNIYGKLQVRSRIQAVARARSLGLV